MRVFLLLVLAAAVFGASAGPASAASSADAATSACGAPRSEAPRLPKAEDDAIPPENDTDCDEVPNEQDNCPTVRNNDQSDVDVDGVGDRCDPNADNDAWDNQQDHCPLLPTAVNDPNACLVDTDSDGTMDPSDTCRRVYNPDQKDTDGDTYGDACDGDDDDDYDLDPADNCPLAPNPDQSDADGDGVGDACDPSTSIVSQQPSTADPGAVADADRRAPTLTVRAARVQRRSDAAGGMPLWARCSEACAIGAEVTISARDARRLGVARAARRPVVVAEGEAAVDAAGSTYVFFEFTRTATRRLFKSASIRATLHIRVVDAAGNRAAPIQRTLLLRR